MDLEIVIFCFMWTEIARKRVELCYPGRVKVTE